MEEKRIMHPKLEEFPVLDSTEAVTARSRRVSLHLGASARAVAKWGHLMNAQNDWLHECHFFDGTEETARWIFVLDVLNHCFWAGKNRTIWSVAYRGNEYSGYWGLAASLKRAMDDGLPLTDPAFLADISVPMLNGIFHGKGEVPLFEARLANLREAGRVLLDRWRGDVVNLIEAAGKSAVRLVLEVVRSFPSFRDQAVYDGRNVYFWKRAQLFAADLHAAFEGRGWGEFNDLDRLTAFADYKLPQVLRQFGIISYDPELSAKIGRQEEIVPGSDEEIEIRAATIVAVESLRRVFEQSGKDLSSVAIDNWLWNLGQQDIFRREPYHRCRTIFY